MSEKLRTVDMTPTSDERREVAARLRKCGAELSILGADCETGFHVIDKVIGCREEDSWERFLARLADLIDPCPSMADEQMGKLRRRSTALASMTRIASDMSGWAGELADSCERMSRARIADDVKRFADRIRQEARDALN